MELKLVTDLFDALGKVADGLKARVESKVPGLRFFHWIELMPLRLARVVFPARIARNELRRKLSL